MKDKKKRKRENGELRRNENAKNYTNKCMKSKKRRSK
jgi:hypothetical protein